MGQYYKIVNLDKRQYLNPCAFGDGLKLMEFACSSHGTLAGLAILLANSNGRGGGDLRSDHEIIGSWAGDRIVVAGDYAMCGDRGEPSLDDSEPNLYSLCWGADDYEDISATVIEAMREDPYLDDALAQN